MRNKYGADAQTGIDRFIEYVVYIVYIGIGINREKSFGALSIVYAVIRLHLRDGKLFIYIRYAFGADIGGKCAHGKHPGKLSVFYYGDIGRT